MNQRRRPAVGLGSQGVFQPLDALFPSETTNCNKMSPPVTRKAPSQSIAWPADLGGSAGTTNHARMAGGTDTAARTYRHARHVVLNLSAELHMSQ